MNLSTKHKEKRHVVVKVQGTVQVWGEMEREYGVSRSKLLCIVYRMDKQQGPSI